MSTEDEHTRWVENVGAYVLGALAEDEERDFENHLASCEACRQEVDSLRPVAHALAIAAPSTPPPAELRGRVMQVVNSEAELLRAATAGPERSAASDGRRRSGRRWLPRVAIPWPALAVPAVALLLVLGGLLGAQLAGGPGDEQVQTVEAEVDPGAAPDASAVLRVSDDGATLVAENLPLPPDGRVYQVWVKRPELDPEPTRTLFMPRDDGSAAAAVTESLDGVEAVLVSDEPPGGSAAPTSTPILSVSPPA